MPFIPLGIPLDILGDYPWNAWIDGAPVGNGPHTVPRGECKFVCDHKSADGHSIQNTKGMRGQIIERKGPVGFGADGSVKMFIKGVTDQSGGRDKWVPRCLVIMGIGETAGKKDSRSDGKAE